MQQDMQWDFRNIVAFTACLISLILGTFGTAVYRERAGLMVVLSGVALLAGFVPIIVYNRIKFGVFFVGKLKK